MSGLRPDLAWARAVVFDLDGTLADTFADLAASLNRVRAGRGLSPLSLEEVRRHVGRGAANLVRNTLPVLGEAAVAAATREFVEDYSHHLLDATRPYPGVVEALEALRGLPMVVLSNKPAAETRATIDGLGLAPFFAAVYGGDSFSVMKPDPGALLAAISPLGVRPDETLLVGDSDVDVATARAAGCRVVLVRTGLSDRATLSPDAFVDDLRGLCADHWPLQARPVPASPIAAPRNLAGFGHRGIAPAVPDRGRRPAGQPDGPQGRRPPGPRRRR